MNKDFLDALEKRIEGKTLLGEILIDDEDDCTDSDVEPPSKRPKRSSKKKKQLSNKTSNKKKKKGGNKPMRDKGTPLLELPISSYEWTKRS